MLEAQGVGHCMMDPDTSLCLTMLRSYSTWMTQAEEATQTFAKENKVWGVCVR